MSRQTAFDTGNWDAYECVVCGIDPGADAYVLVLESKSGRFSLHPPCRTISVRDAGLQEVVTEVDVMRMPAEERLALAAAVRDANSSHH